MKHEYPIRGLCELLGVAPSGCYRYRQKRLPKRQREDATLAVQIAVAHEGSCGTYGAPRLAVELGRRRTRENAAARD